MDSSQSQELPVPDATPVNSKQTQPYDEEILDLSPDDPYGSTAIDPVAAPQSTLKSDTSQSTKASDQQSVLGNGEGVELQAIPDPRFTPGAPVEIPKPDPFPDEPETGGDPSVEDPRSVMQIKLNRLTGGYNFDGKPGHEGLMVVIEPQNRFGTYTRASGELTIEVTDPSRSGVAGRVGKWKFDSIDTRRFIKETRSVKGVEMQLPWPGAPPENRRLQLDVSYQLADGRTLTAEKKILVIPVTSALVAKANGGQTNWSPQRPATPTLQTQTKSPSVSHRQASSSWLPNR